ncbi:MAG TPA: RNA polymerase sigma factor [Kiritimatiellia bacterium]|nr:RNA polymerase sigma factor [Kiritimatiellia bacterium]
MARLNYKLHHEGKIRQYKGPLKFLPWLRMLAVRERANFFREKQRDEKVIRGSSDDEASDLPEADGTGMAPSSHQRPDQVLVSAEILGAIAACLERLPPKDRQIIEYRSVDGYDAEQIAAALRTKTENAYLLLHRAREKLMACLEKSGVRVPVSRKSVKDKRGKDVSP